MDCAKTLSDHYHHGNLLSAIEAGLEKQDIQPQNASVESLGPVDEFHIGGRQASVHFLDQLSIFGSQTILDIGRGLGGSTRFDDKRSLGSNTYVSRPFRRLVLKTYQY